MILLRSEIAQGLDNTLDGVRQALQQAIELEHSTIPPYLYALYSLQPGANSAIAGIITSVVLEEMLHMSLACNVLNAIGGAPLIDSPSFIPTYPGPLPGGVENGLIVPLAPFSLDILENVFMAIEEPEDPLSFPVGPQLELAAAAPPPLTIGQFYTLIIEQITALGESIFTGDPLLQLTMSFATTRYEDGQSQPLASIPLFAVTDVASATRALGLIIDQGEGTTTTPLDLDQEPAHYYRYAEILYGRRLIANQEPSPPNPPFIYGGAAVPFDSTRVWPVILNPTSSVYPAGSPAAKANDAFNATYTSLLQCLHAVFNGTPDRMATAVLSMQALRQQAGHLMSIEIAPGTNAGPSFQYMPTR